MRIAFDLVETTSEMLDNQLVSITITHSNKKIEKFVEEIGNLVDIDFFNTSLTEVNAYGRLMKMRKSKVSH